jgi:hypothetical protein
VVTVQGSGANSIQAVAANSTVIVTCISTSGTTAASWQATYTVSGAGGGTVTNSTTLTANALMLGNGGTDSKVATGLTTDGTSAINLGVAGSSVGKGVFANATSGTITLQPVTGALGTVTLSLPAATDTLVGKATTDTLTNKTLVAPALGAATATSINFGGTSLTTYAEGTWTPVVTLGGGNTGLTYSRQAGAYTKIGNIVCIMTDITLSAKGSSTGALAITGLPFAPGSVGTTFAVETGSSTWTGLTAGVMARVSNGATSMSFRAYTTSGTGSTASITDAVLTNTSVINFSGCYLS